MDIDTPEMNRPVPVEAILWDNDGVLVDTERLYYRATKEILNDAGIEFTPQMFIEISLTRAKGLWHLAEEKGIPQDEIERLRDRRNDLYGTLLQEEEVVVDGVRETLERLHGRYAMGVVTSSRRDHFEIIHSRTGLLDYFDFVLTGGDCPRLKPYPDPYLKAAELSGKPKENCLVIEDTPRGLAAALNAEMRCWIVPTELTRDCNFAGADRILNRVTDVADRLVSV